MTKKQKGVTNWPRLRNNAQLANGNAYAVFGHQGGAILIISPDCEPLGVAVDGFFTREKKIDSLDITHLNKKLTPAGIAHKEAGWPYGVPAKGFEQ